MSHREKIFEGGLQTPKSSHLIKSGAATPCSGNLLACESSTEGFSAVPCVLLQRKKKKKKKKKKKNSLSFQLVSFFIFN